MAAGGSGKKELISRFPFFSFNTVRHRTSQESQIAALEKLGFGVTKGRKHYKLRRDNSAFFTSVSATPSDKRAGANLTAEFVKLFF